MRRIMTALAGGMLAVLTLAPPVLGGPPTSPTRGVAEPATDACPWPDFLNDEIGALKCLPNQIPWTHFTFGDLEESGARIIADPLEDVGAGGASGTVLFWCQFRAGLSYQIRVSGLDPLSVYTVRASGEGYAFATGPVSIDQVLGTIRTDANGGGSLNGLLRLAEGLYELDISIRDGVGSERLSVPADDLIGFAVL